MLKTKNLISSLYDIPKEWIFENYLNLPYALTGQDVKMKSMITTTDTNPSFCIYADPIIGYRFKDFSSGYSGDGVELVKILHRLADRFEAGAKIMNDYNLFVAANGIRKQSLQHIPEKYKVVSFKTRLWSIRDKDYWTAYHIDSKTLDFFIVKPLERFTLQKKGSVDQYVIRGFNIYGYFKLDGTLYKIYQPLSQDNKFFKVKDYIQGAEQLTYKKPYLLIGSGLKDIMCFTRLQFSEVEVLAPDSENIMLSPKSIQKIKTSYRGCCTLFDNDSAGIKAMKKYEETYNIPYIHLKVEKDLAKCSKVHDLRNTREFILPQLEKVLFSQ